MLYDEKPASHPARWHPHSSAMSCLPSAWCELWGFQPMTQEPSACTPERLPETFPEEAPFKDTPAFQRHVMFTLGLMWAWGVPTCDAGAVSLHTREIARENPRRGPLHKPWWQSCWHAFFSLGRATPLHYVHPASQVCSEEPLKPEGIEAHCSTFMKFRRAWCVQETYDQLKCSQHSKI